MEKRDNENSGSLDTRACTPAVDEFPKRRQTRKRGRPRKDVDVGVMFHMLKNNAPIAVVARHLRVHRETINTNFRQVIEEARARHREEWRKIWDERSKILLEEKRLKEASKRKKRRYHRGYFDRWRPRPK